MKGVGRGVMRFVGDELIRRVGVCRNLFVGCGLSVIATKAIPIGRVNENGYGEFRGSTTDGKGINTSSVCRHVMSEHRIRTTDEYGRSERTRKSEGSARNVRASECE